jgi:hypothetical protein
MTIGSAAVLAIFSILPIAATPARFEAAAPIGLSFS